jgi:N6-adenosine-specific RNA methylase IME4
MLAKLGKALALLKECHSATQAKEIIDVAIAAKVYAQRQRVSKDIIIAATALEIEARTCLGEILAAGPKNTGTAGLLVGPGRGKKNGSTRREPPFPQPPTLEELGISKKESSTAQFLANLKRDDRELFDAVRSSKKSIPEAQHAVKTKAIKLKLEIIAAREPEDPVGKFDLLVIDPPWPMEKPVQDGNSSETRELDYPTMSLEDIEKENLVKKFAAENCHLFLWTTHRFLPAALAILEKWGVKYSCTFVWHKDGGRQPTGLPQFNCEFCLYGKVGSPVFVDTKDFPTCFYADRTRHSEKPEKFYETLRRVTAGRRLDAYNRRKIEGFIGWGNEAQ